jgi:predicted GTPase
MQLRWSIADTYSIKQHMRAIPQAMGYKMEHNKNLQETIDRAEMNMVVADTSVDLNRIMEVNTPIVLVRYELAEIDRPTSKDFIVERFGPFLMGSSQKDV